MSRIKSGLLKKLAYLSYASSLLLFGAGISQGYKFSKPLPNNYTFEQENNSNTLKEGEKTLRDKYLINAALFVTASAGLSIAGSCFSLSYIYKSSEEKNK